MACRAGYDRRALVASRGHTFLAAEPVWSMYAPEPWRFTGWWVAVGETASGDLVDPITGRRPSLQPPPLGESMLRWAYLWNPPSTAGPSFSAAPTPSSLPHPITPEATDAFGTADAYEQFLLRRNLRQPPGSRLQWLAMVYVYEALDGSEQARQRPLLTRVWTDHVPARHVAEALGTLYHVDVDSIGAPDWRPVPIILPASDPR